MLNAEHTNTDGFITGIDIHIAIDKSDSQNEKLQSSGFLEFLAEVQHELNTAVAVFIKVNGHDPEWIKHDQVDLNSLFANNAHYQDFLALFARTQANIAQFIAADLPEQAAHQAIVDEVVNLRAFIESRYANPEPAAGAPQPKRKLEFFLGMGIVFLPIVFAWFTLRQGYANLVRIVSFVWLAVFLLATLPSAKDNVKHSPLPEQHSPGAPAESSVTGPSAP